MIPFVIDSYDGISVIRDDAVLGGTKRRVIAAVLQSIDYDFDRGFGTPRNKQHFTYASPTFGYAQIAVAIGCQEIGAKVTIFVPKRKQMHPRSALAADHGAEIIQVPMGFLSHCAAKAKQFAIDSGATLLPFGLDCPVAIRSLSEVAKSTKLLPKEVWCVAGSGVLTRALQLAWPDAKHCVVTVGCKSAKVGNAAVYESQEPFAKDAKIQPPFLTVSNYDAKAWVFVKRHARPGALFWNVGGDEHKAND